jgi:hypothetical protein
MPRNGDFEFILSAEPQTGNWIRLERASKDNLVLVREAFDDWEQPRAEINIQMIEDGRAGDIALPEGELTRRLQLATDYVQFYGWDWSAELTNRMLEEAGANAFHHGIFASNQGAGNNPSASYPGAVYDLSEHEAIVVETDLPKAHYWNVQLADPMWQVIDFTYHHSSINNYQAHIGADGRLRVIVSRRDPGIDNWLDPVDNPFGIVFFRFYRADRRVEPKISFVGSLDDALKTIPADTPRISSPQRKDAMVRRSAAARERFRD